MVIEPRDGQGRLLAAPADVQVAVLDPKLPGQDARVARWNLTAAETAAQLRGGADSGIHLTLPWRNNRPKHAKLHLFVRYLTGDGRKIEADQPIEVVLPSDRSAGWISFAARSFRLVRGRGCCDAAADRSYRRRRAPSHLVARAVARRKDEGGLAAFIQCPRNYFAVFGVRWGIPERSRTTTKVSISGVGDFAKVSRTTQPDHSKGSPG